MARSDKPGMIDGFMSVQAVRHKGDRPPDKKPPKDAPAIEDTEVSQSDSALPQKQASIGRTALPSRHELICYSCGYAFVIAGSLNKVFCPKCREKLETSDHNIDGMWKEDIRTVGRVHVLQGATVQGATLVATDIVIAGDCTQANLQPTRRIELNTGARVRPDVLDKHQVHVVVGARLMLDAPLRCNTLDIYGELQATAEPTGMVTIHPGGMFRGTLKAEHLVVHDGGGLSASLQIAPARAEEPQPPTNETHPPPYPQPSGTHTKTPNPESKSRNPEPRTPNATPKPTKPKPTTQNSKTAAKRVSANKGKKRASKRAPRKVE